MFSSSSFPSQLYLSLSLSWRSQSLAYYMSLIWPAWISSPFKPSPVKIEDYILAGLRDENTGYNYWLLLTWHVFIKEEQSMISTCILWRIILAIFSFLHFLHNLRAIFYSLYWRALRRKWNLERKPIMDGQYILPCFPSSPPLLEEKIRKEVAVSHYEGKRVGQEQHLEQESIRLLIFHHRFVCQFVKRIDFYWSDAHNRWSLSFLSNFHYL